MPFHAFFGIAMMTMASNNRWSVLPQRCPAVAVRHRQRPASRRREIVWGSGEPPVIVVVIALVRQWAQQDRRVASLSDRHVESSYANEELDAYKARSRGISLAGSQESVRGYVHGCAGTQRAASATNRGLHRIEAPGRSLEI
jgi:cytochrome c oxidase assembly factor CtaG